MKGRQARLEDMVGPPESLFEGKDSKEKGGAEGAEGGEGKGKGDWEGKEGNKTE